MCSGTPATDPSVAATPDAERAYSPFTETSQLRADASSCTDDRRAGWTATLNY